jgi:phage baseplate assembly protein W
VSTEFDKPLSGFRFVELQWGESLQQLALRELGDASRWVDIANLNKLLPPYVTDDPVLASDRVALYGATIKVPAATVQADAALDPALVFERDVRLKNGRLSAVGGDFELVEGRGNLHQAINHRLVTDPGDMLYHPEYGCLVRRLIGAANGPTAGLLAAEYVKAALRSDPRVKEVTRIEATMTGDQISVDAEIRPIHGKTINVEQVL